MTLSRFLQVLTKLLEPSLSFQLFGASTPEGRFSQDRQFTFFSSQFSYLSKQTFHPLMPNMFFETLFSFGMCGENEDFDIGLMVILILLLHTTVISSCTENVPW